MFSHTIIGFYVLADLDSSCFQSPPYSPSCLQTTQLSDCSTLEDLVDMDLILSL